MSMMAISNNNKKIAKRRDLYMPFNGPLKQVVVNEDSGALEGFPNLTVLKLQGLPSTGVKLGVNEGEGLPTLLFVRKTPSEKRVYPSHHASGPVV